MNAIKTVFILICLSFSVHAQYDSLLLKNASGKTVKKLGKNALKQDDPYSAVTFLQAYVKENAKDGEALMLLGRSYLRLRDYERAQRAFLQSYNANNTKFTEALYYHALMQKSNAKYDSAKHNFQKFRKEYKGKDKVLKKLASREISFCDSVIKIAGKVNKIQIMHLDTSINKVNTEAAPVVLDENTLIYTSLRTEGREYITEEDTTNYRKRRLYKAKREGNDWKFAGEFGDDFNSDAFNTGNAAFSPDHKRVYFTRCRKNVMEKMICAIYVSEKTADGWSEPVKLPKPVNHPRYSSTMPAVAKDPVKGNDLIFFVSDRKGGKGKLDVWYTIYEPKTKTYRDPKNAGSKINTQQNEMAPFYDNETRALYFSSDGMGGLGGYDIFRAPGDGKKWTIVENVGLPVNSGADDIFYSMSTKRNEGFFVSNRKGGNSLKNSTCCDDIYFFRKTDYIFIKLEGDVVDPLNPEEKLSHAEVEVYVRDKATKEVFLVKTVKSDSAGHYKAEVEAGQDYFVVVKKKEYLGTTGDISTAGITRDTVIKHELALTKKPKGAIYIPNIQYDFDKGNIMEESKAVLDTTILELMIANPELVIEIESHTDSKGSDKYNIKLSQSRAESVVKYLVSKGISPKRLKAKGYGESKPVAPNENPDGSDNPEGRAKNRRTGFRIIGSVDIEIINENE